MFVLNEKTHALLSTNYAFSKPVFKLHPVSYMQILASSPIQFATSDASCFFSPKIAVGNTATITLNVTHFKKPKKSPPFSKTLVATCQLLVPYESGGNTLPSTL
jgi:hypothetical protein